MNILQAYIKKYKQIIILIIGLPCTNKSEIAKELGLDLNLKVIKINDYLIEGKYKEIDINGKLTKIYEDLDSYDWDKFNYTVNQHKSDGLVIYGNYLDSTKIDWNNDFVFFYSMGTKLCKQILLETKMIESISSNPTESDEFLNNYFNNYFNPLYSKIKQSFTVNKYFNVKDDTKFNESYDELFDILMDLITKKLN